MPAGQPTDLQIEALFATAGLSLPAERRAAVFTAARDLKACATLVELFSSQALTAPSRPEAPAAR